ncbi:MAG: methyl-accepting chemotaxis protein [Acidobacteria bacterium]|nr:methyl-accepting chemotaxis protein [Acidobacteriota bacterium]
MRNFTLKTKFRLIIGVAAAGLLTLASFWLLGSRQRILQDKETQLRHLVEIPYSVLVEEQRLEASGQISRAAAQKQALARLRVMRYEQTNYFWVNDLRPTMIMHPIKPEMEGQDLSSYKDPTGKLLFVEMTEVAGKNGEGFVRYMWARPGQAKGEPVPKISFVRKFEPWGWIIGTGIYVDDVEAAWRANAKVAAGTALACLAALIVVSTMTYKALFQRLHEVILRVHDIAEGEGDLTQRITQGTQDELGELARGFNGFLEKLHRAISQVAQNTERLAQASEQISHSSEEQVQGTETQKDRARQVASAMQEMALTVQQVSENSSSAAEAARQASDIAHEGGKILGAAEDNMRVISESLTGTARMVEELGQRSDQIGKIVETINDIADQTNLLALNAAIEAARAGEMGRGFAVVADEVRKLAERTTAATQEIAQMIHRIQTETHSTVVAMKAGTGQFEQGVQATHRAGESLRQVIHMSEQVGDMITRIATAATEQAATTSHINSGVSEIAQITESSAERARRTLAQMEELSQLSGDLQALVGQFKLHHEKRGGTPGPSASRSRARLARAAAG